MACTCGPNWDPSDPDSCSECKGRAWVEIEEKGKWLCKCCAHRLEDGEMDDKPTCEGKDREFMLSCTQSKSGRKSKGITKCKVLHKIEGREIVIPDGTDSVIYLEHYRARHRPEIIKRLEASGFKVLPA